MCLLSFQGDFSPFLILHLFLVLLLPPLLLLLVLILLLVLSFLLFLLFVPSQAHRNTTNKHVFQ
jgi:hypothetical protein